MNVSAVMDLMAAPDETAATVIKNITHLSLTAGV
jgi:hypothetical protein